MSDTEVILAKLTEIIKQTEKNQELLHSKLAVLDSQLDKVNIVLAVQDTNTMHFKKRLEDAESRIESLQGQLEPMKAHMQRWAGVGKALSVLVAIIGAVVAILAALP